MEKSRPKMLQSKIPVKASVKPNFSSVFVSRNIVNKNEEKQKFHSKAALVKEALPKETLGTRVQPKINTVVFKSTKPKSQDIYKRTGMKGKFSTKSKNSEKEKFFVSTLKRGEKLSEINKKNLKPNNVAIINKIKKQQALPSVAESVKKSNASNKNFPKIDMKTNQSNNKQNNFHQVEEKIATKQKDDFSVIEFKETQKNSNHISQQNIEFVADERFRKLILCEKELTPSILKPCYNRNMSSMYDRPSIYKKIEIPKDPYKEALAAIENIDHVTQEQRACEMKNINHCQSPFKDRFSIYNQKYIFTGDPYEIALNSLSKLEVKQKVKNKKKVTFNLPATNSFSETVTKKDCEKENKFRLTYANEKLEEARNNLVPEYEKDCGNVFSVKISAGSSLVTDLDSENVSGDSCYSKNIFNKETDLCSDKISIVSSPVSRTLQNIKENPLNFGMLTIPETPSNMENAATLHPQIRNSVIRSANPLLSQASEFMQSLLSKRSDQVSKRTFSRICTPQPVLFFQQAKMTGCMSPEFLSKRTSNIITHAPLNTPLVLRNLAKCDLSPVSKKLDFSDSHEESKLQIEDSKEDDVEDEILKGHKSEGEKENTQILCQNILTQQKILDQIADQECSIFMYDAAFPAYCRSDLLNPIAETLNDGDEMHFVPLGQQ
ncbi:uncharacterized protein CDAR_240131 [Caerostris darwini]|uniref:Uncharacterized protein n=1 Tax=Caerostris darwini TaxID=1538125 RepID=A0AAV4V414_9ARAC|nr:uncharacterized protein CDAR_240131 [Caerostris darwini]